MSEKTSESIELHQADIDYLKEMARKYKLPDIGKAVRCLINHAREQTDLEKDIYDTIRCPHC
jgi:DNA polymerase/3'-5' exonuclease PolX